MGQRFKPMRVQSGLRAMLRTFGEFVHVSAIYLGLALLTTMILAFVLPSMRQQFIQVHELVLGMFQSYEVDNSLMLDPNKHDWSLPENLLREPNLTGVETTEELINSEALEHDSKMRDDLPTGAEHLSFSSTLAASMRGMPISGINQAQDKALRSYLSRKYKIANSVAGAIVRAVFIVGKEKQLDPQLLLAVIAIESRYNPFAESSVGAQGLMQVMTSVHADKLRDSGGPAAIFNPIVNIRVGSQILYDCVKRRGSIRGGLACYVGATGPSDGGYGSKVLAERRRIALASGIPLKD